MKKIIEQINNKGKIISDYDENISIKQIKDILGNHFKILNDKNPFSCKSGNKEFNLCVKQITYLGHPHPVFKKRIQIPKEWKVYLKTENTLLVGIYRYKKNNIFVFFDVKKYKNNNLNNSSAHVHTIDLQKGVEYGIFEKIDSRGNKINVVKEERLSTYVNNVLSHKKSKKPKEIELFDEFSSSLKKKWEGKKCYEEMFKSNYSKKGQGEWAGTYLEYKFENYLEENPELKFICSYESKKKKGELDFDLDFSGKFLGDLKAHTVSSGAIPGNDKKNFFEAFNLHKKFWYIVFYHQSFKDTECGCEVTIFWNKLQNKEDLFSYASRMKNSVILESMKILEINKDNIKYISDMSQGKNSNGNKREMKIQIKSSAVDNFLIYNKKL